MADARLGNQFWKLRSKHGRDFLFATPELLWEAACEYFEHTDRRKWKKKDWVGKDAIEVERETETPYTLTGLFLYIDCDKGYFNAFKKNLDKKDLDQRGKDFFVIIARIEQIIYTQKFEGASVGAFNANIIARDLGLRDGADITSGGESITPQITTMIDGKIIDLKVKE